MYQEATEGNCGFAKRDCGITHQVDELTKRHIKRNYHWFSSVL